MGSEEIKVNKTGIQISYMRFLSDSAIGYLTFILLFVYYKTGTPIFGFELNNFIGGGVSKETRLFLFLLILLLSTPFGFVFNISSLIFIGKIQYFIENIFFNMGFLMQDAKKRYDLNNAKKSFNINSENWFSKCGLAHEVLCIYYPDLIKDIEHLKGIIIFMRNVSLMMIILALGSFLNIANLTIFFTNLKLLIIYVFFFSVSIFLCGGISFLYDLVLISRALILTEKKEKILI